MQRKKRNSIENNNIEYKSITMLGSKGGILLVGWKLLLSLKEAKQDGLKLKRKTTA